MKLCLPSFRCCCCCCWYWCYWLHSGRFDPAAGPVVESGVAAEGTLPLLLSPLPLPPSQVAAGLDEVTSAAVADIVVVVAAGGGDEIVVGVAVVDGEGGDEDEAD